MSEYWIVAVHYHPAGPIEQVQAMLFSAANNSLGPMQLISREVIVHWLTNGFATVFTAFTTGPNQWRKGAQVQLTTNGAFITTEPDGRTYNNLAHLPRY